MESEFSDLDRFLNCGSWNAAFGPENGDPLDLNCPRIEEYNNGCHKSSSFCTVFADLSQLTESGSDLPCSKE